MKNKFDDENDFQCCNKCDLPDTLQIVNVVLKSKLPTHAKRWDGL